jgi:hypothetical protein
MGGVPVPQAIAWLHTTFTVALVFGCCEACVAAAGLGIPLAVSVLVSVLFVDRTGHGLDYLTTGALVLGSALDLTWLIQLGWAMWQCFAASCRAPDAFAFVVNANDTVCNSAWLTAVFFVMFTMLGLKVGCVLYSYRPAFLKNVS